MSFKDRLAKALEVPTNVIVIDGFLSLAECHDIVSLAGGKTYVEGEVGDDVKYVSSPAMRKVEVASLTDDEFPRERLRRAAENAYSTTLLPAGPMLLLKYEIGGHYVSHTDACKLVATDTGSFEAHRVMNRDLSVVVYLNDEFEGGDFEFVHTGQIVRPEPGKLVMFPSGWHHEHRVAPTTSGTRWAIVNWFETSPRLVRDIERVNAGGMRYYQRNS